MFISEMMRMPRRTPVTAETIETTEIRAIRISWVGRPEATPIRRSRPTAIWLTPSPSEVATPNTQPSTPRISTRCPIGPKMRSPMKGWSAERSASGSPLR